MEGKIKRRKVLVVCDLCGTSIVDMGFGQKLARHKSSTYCLKMNCETCGETIRLSLKNFHNSKHTENPSSSTDHPSTSSFTHQPRLQGSLIIVDNICVPCCRLISLISETTVWREALLQCCPVQVHLFIVTVPQTSSRAFIVESHLSRKI